MSRPGWIEREGGLLRRLPEVVSERARREADLIRNAESKRQTIEQRHLEEMQTAEAVFDATILRLTQENDAERQASDRRHAEARANLELAWRTRTDQAQQTYQERKTASDRDLQEARQRIEGEFAQTRQRLENEATAATQRSEQAVARAKESSDQARRRAISERDGKQKTAENNYNLSRGTLRQYQNDLRGSFPGARQPLRGKRLAISGRESPSLRGRRRPIPHLPWRSCLKRHGSAHQRARSFVPATRRSTMTPFTRSVLANALVLISLALFAACIYFLLGEKHVMVEFLSIFGLAALSCFCPSWPSGYS